MFWHSSIISVIWNNETTSAFIGDLSFCFAHIRLHEDILYIPWIQDLEITQTKVCDRLMNWVDCEHLTGVAASSKIGEMQW